MEYIISYIKKSAYYDNHEIMVNIDCMGMSILKFENYSNKKTAINTFSELWNLTGDIKNKIIIHVNSEEEFYQAIDYYLSRYNYSNDQKNFHQEQINNLYLHLIR